MELYQCFPEDQGRKTERDICQSQIHAKCATVTFNSATAYCDDVEKSYINSTLQLFHSTRSRIINRKQ